jgi:hypothetical protein
MGSSDEQIGHGKLGMRSGLRTFDELIEQSDSYKGLIAIVKPGLEIVNWSLDTGEQYIAPFSTSFDSVRKDVVGVRTLNDPSMTRANSITLSAGEYYYDPSEEFTQSTINWDQGTSDYWDDGVTKWDQFHKIRARPSDRLNNPNEMTVVGQLGFYFADEAQVHPTLGPNLLTDGGLEDWTCSTDPTYWTVVSDVARSSTNVRGGSYSAQIGDRATIEQSSITVQDGAYYRLSGYYVAHKGTLGVSINFNGAGISCDGISQVSSSHYVTLPTTPTTDVYQTFSWDVKAFDTDATVGFYNSKSTTLCYVDDVKFQRIWRYEYYEPRLSAQSAPKAVSGIKDILFGGNVIGSASLVLNNHDAYFDTLCGERDSDNTTISSPIIEWVNAEVDTRVGGRFHNEPSGDGQEILISDTITNFLGLVKEITVTDQEVMLSLEDRRSEFHMKLPLRTYSLTEFPNMDPGRVGEPRPLLFHTAENIKPVRISETQTSVSGTEEVSGRYEAVYEFLDCTDFPGIYTGTAINVYSFSSESEADRFFNDLRPGVGMAGDFNTIGYEGRTLSSTYDYEVDTDKGRFTIIRDVQQLRVVDNESDEISFESDGGGESNAFIGYGALYDGTETLGPEDLATRVQSFMRAAGAGDENCTYNNGSGKFTISKDSGTLTLKIQSGSNTSRSIYKIMGFSGSTDKSGSLSYESDESIFTGASGKHVLRVSAVGFRDDSLGTYTGTANSLIQYPRHVIKAIALAVMNKPSSSLGSSFSGTLSNDAASGACVLYVNSVEDSGRIFERLADTDMAHFVLKNDGVAEFIPLYKEFSSKDVFTVNTRDIQSWKVRKGYSDIYETASYSFVDTSDIHNRLVVTLNNKNSVTVRLRRRDSKIIESQHRYEPYVRNTARRLATLTSREHRIIEMRVLGSALLKAEVGDRVTITRDRAFSSAGSLSGQRFRILTLSKDYKHGYVDVTVTDDITGTEA